MTSDGTSPADQAVGVGTNAGHAASNRPDGEDRAQVERSEATSRMLAFSDAIVAIAITLLVLPLIDIEPPGEGQSVWTVISDNQQQFTTFLLSFGITLLFWRRHYVAFSSVHTFNGPLTALNFAWLLLIVLFQFPSKMVGDSDNSMDGSATLYAAYLAAVGLLTMFIAIYLGRHPELGGRKEFSSRREIFWLLGTYAWISMIAIISVWVGARALYLLLVLVVYGQLENWDQRRHARRQQQPDADRAAT